MKAITVNYRKREPKTFYYDILNDIVVNVKYRDSRGMCKGTSNGELFEMAWYDHGNEEYLDDWTNDDNGPSPINYSAHVREALVRFFQ